jgi:WS/DGAT/MGAT family acyltransferase
VDDPSFDITHHVRHARVPPPGGEADLLALAEDLLGTPLDLTRPLWEVWLVDGLADGRVAVIDKIHHAMSDGLGGVELVTVIFDLEARPPAPADGEVPEWRPERPPPVPLAAARDLGRLATIPLRAGLFGIDCLRHPVRHTRRALRLADALSTVARPSLLAPRLSINAPVHPGRRLAVVRLSLSDLHAVGHQFGVTVNDIVLTVVASGVGALLESRGQPVHGREVHLLVPVGLVHDTGHGHTLGNEVSALFVRAPLGLADPLARLRAVAADVGQDKVHHQQLVAQCTLGLLDPLPQSALGAVSGLIGRQPVFNLVVTNVPGPPVPLYVLGEPMTEAVAFVPIAGNLSLGVAALSYCDAINLGVLADRDACPDLDEFAKGLELGAAELLSAAGAAKAEADEAAHRSAVASHAEPGPDPAG